MQCKAGSAVGKSVTRVAPPVFSEDGAVLSHVLEGEGLSVVTRRCNTPMRLASAGFRMVRMEIPITAYNEGL